MPWLPEGRLVSVPGRGEVFARVHRHPDPDRPTLLLLHGWTASADLQWFTAYEELAELCSFVAVDHRGHGRGIRDPEPFRLEDVADDAAAVVGALGIDRVVAVGYSMGGPISMHLHRRHPALVSGLVLMATALEWRATRLERLRWAFLVPFGSFLRSWSYPRLLGVGLNRFARHGHDLAPYVRWLAGEIRRNDQYTIVQAGRAISRHDARDWSFMPTVPAAVVLTTRDRLVRPRKQRALAAALDAAIVELDGDHLVPWERPRDFAAATVAGVRRVIDRR
jgi:3-oxoadipate enol-lactonase